MEGTSGYTDTLDDAKREFATRVARFSGEDRQERGNVQTALQIAGGHWERVSMIGVRSHGGVSVGPVKRRSVSGVDMPLGRPAHWLQRSLKRPF
jgi:hypothetical protein